MITIAVDAMGGDNAPKSEVEGALRAVRSLDVRVILVGREQIIKVRINDLVKGKLKGNIPVRPGDVLVVPESLF